MATLCLLALLPAVVSAATIDKRLTVNVHIVCDDSGNNCASTGPAGDGYFAAEANMIWEQAGIAMSFVLDPVRTNDTNHLNIVDSTFGRRFCDLFSPTASWGTCGTSSPTLFPYVSSTVNLYLVHTVIATGGAAYGEGWLGLGGLVIAMDDVMAFNAPTGRLDTIAHELGHNLGLWTGTGSAQGHSTDANDLMAAGGIRSIPTTLAQISTDGLTGFDRLPADQAAAARQSGLLQDVFVPEPGTWMPMLFGTVGMVLARRMKRFAAPRSQRS